MNKNGSNKFSFQLFIDIKNNLSAIFLPHIVLKVKKYVLRNIFRGVVPLNYKHFVYIKFIEKTVVTCDRLCSIYLRNTILNFTVRCVSDKNNRVLYYVPLKNQ